MFKTGLSNISIECQRHFAYLPIIQQRTAMRLQYFIASKNLVCSLFANVITTQLNYLFSAYGRTVNPPNNQPILRRCVPRRGGYNPLLDFYLRQRII